MANQTATSLNAVIEEIVSVKVQETLINEAVVLGSIMDVSANIGPGMDTYKMARLSQLAVQDKSESTTIVPQVSTVVTDDLIIDKHKIVGFRLEDKADMQSKVNMVTALLQDAARSHAAKVDDDIIAQLKLASVAAPDHIVPFLSVGVIAQGDIINCKKLLRKADVSSSEKKYLLLPAEQEANMLAIGDFVRADSYGNSGGLMNGEVGRLYGFTVLITNSSELPDDSFLAYAESACAVGFQQAPKVEQQRQALDLSTDFVLSQLYGVKTLYGGIKQVYVNP